MTKRLTDKEVLELDRTIALMEYACRRSPLKHAQPWQVWDEQAQLYGEERTRSRTEIARTIAMGVRLRLVEREGPYGIRVRHYGYKPVTGWRAKLEREARVR